ncbi:MAG: efflux RND transporter periplasmic adaptor subunit [Verrucomicrobia bacterium]|nr:efflux RND transporter periplasmic adaptor subunit [Verrucomicrobiota bacterium]
MKFITLFTLAAGLALVTGCRPHTHNNAEDEQGHGHAHDKGAAAAEEKTAQITVWSDRYEVFAEHKAPVAGTKTTFITHVTDLQTLKPRDEGPVKFVLTHGNDVPIEHLQAGPARAGIYLPAITFPKAGDWKVELLVAGASVDLGMIEVYPDKKAALQAEFAEPAEGITFLKEQQWKILTRTERAENRVVIEHARLPATVTPKPGSMASVVAPVSGRLILPPNKPLPLPGQKVAAGELLVLLQPTFSEQAARLLEAEAEAIRAKGALDQAKLVLERTKRLAASEAKSNREVQEAEFALASAQAQFEAATALQATYKKLSPGSEESGKRLDLSSIELRSPMEGVISQVGSNLGAPVTPETVLFTILNAETVWLEARLPENRLVSGKPTGTFQTGREGASIPAEFVYLGMQIDASTRTAPIMFEAANTNGALRIGQTVQLFVATAEQTKGVAIPISAIVEEEGRSVAFVQLSGETFAKRDLTLGVSGGGYVQVLEGVTEGERVVSKGAYAIRLASVSSVIPAHGHAH